MSPLLLGVCACGSADGGFVTAPQPDPPDAANVDASAEDAPASAGVSVCPELGVQTVSEKLSALSNEFAVSVKDDCRVVQILLPLTPATAAGYLERIEQWSFEFLGCAGNGAGAATGFPLVSSVGYTVTQLDVEVVSDHYLDALRTVLGITPDHEGEIRPELAKLANGIVNIPGPGHALELCQDAGRERK
jgi:hypothetical protein